MFQTVQALKVAVEDYDNGLLSYSDFMRKIILILAESQQSVEIAGWLRDTFVDGIENHETSQI